MSWYDEYGDSIGNWDHFLRDNLDARGSASIDAVIQQANLKTAAAAKALRKEPCSGNRVSLAADLQAMMYLKRLPQPAPGVKAAEGTIVRVRTAHGSTTHYNNQVWVLWDDGQLVPTPVQYLRRPLTNTRRASHLFRQRLAHSMLMDQFLQAQRHDELVHRPTKDLWSCRQEGDSYVIERLFDASTGQPLKGV